MSRRFPVTFYLALAANLFAWAGLQWVYVTLPGYIGSLGGGATEIGLANGLVALSVVAARPAAGRLVDRWGRKPMLLLGAGVFALCSALYALLPSLLPFMLVRLLQGAGLAAFTTAYTALIADLAPPARRGEAIGLSGMTNNLGLLFAPALGASAQAAWGYGNHFLVASAISAAGLALLLPVHEPVRPETTPEQRVSFWSVARMQPIWIVALGGTGVAVAYGAVLSFMAPFAAARGLTAAAGYYTAFALALMGAQALAGRLSDRISRRAAALPGLAIAGLSMAGLALVHSNAGLLASGAGLGLGWGLARTGLDSAVADASPLEARGAAFGFSYACFDLGVGTGSFALGVVAQGHGYAAAFALAALWAAGALAWYATGTRRRPSAS
jgi:MFS family permease